MVMTIQWQMQKHGSCCTESLLKKYITISLCVLKTYITQCTYSLSLTHTHCTKIDGSSNELHTEQT